MKILSLISLFLISFNSLSCPELSGKYFCQNSNREVTELSLKFRNENQVYIYDFVEASRPGSWIVDGQEHRQPVVQMDGVSNLRYVARCTERQLLLSLDGDLNDLSSKISLNISMSLDAQSNLVQETNGMINGSTPLPIIEATCYRGTSVSL